MGKPSIIINNGETMKRPVFQSMLNIHERGFLGKINKSITCSKIWYGFIAWNGVNEPSTPIIGYFFD